MTSIFCFTGGVLLGVAVGMIIAIIFIGDKNND